MAKFTTAIANLVSVAGEHRAAERAGFTPFLESLFYSPQEATVRRVTRVALNTLFDPRTWKGGGVADEAQ